MLDASIQIRPATADDEAGIKQMIRDEHLDPTFTDWRNFLIAEIDGQTAGIGQIRRILGAEELGSLVVLPEFRGRGVGAALITALEAKAKRPLHLFCEGKNESYYARFGYRSIPPLQAPGALKIKALLVVIVQAFGVSVKVMRKA